MTDYFVRVSGSDAAAGTSAGAAWLTLGKALGASGIASGDTVWIGAGVYREDVTVAMTSATAETFVRGDTDGSQTGDAGEVVLSSWTSGDTAAPSVNNLIDLAGRDFLTFENLTLQHGAVAIGALTTTSTSITIRNCAFNGLGGVPATGGGNPIQLKVAFGVTANWLVERCVMVSLAVVYVELVRGTGADYDAAVVIRNNLMVILGGDVVLVNGSGAGANKGGGVIVENCTLVNALSGVGAFDVSTSIPVIVRNSMICAVGADAGGFNALECGVSGELVENFNVIHSFSPYSNVTPGANSVADGSYAPALEIGQSLMRGANPRPFGMPTAGSALLGFGGTSPPAVDLLNAPRPAGGESDLAAVGAYERGNTFARETTTVRTGSNAISITGPGYQDFALPVPASAQTVTAYVRWDATYTGTKPKMLVLNGTEAGVADATDTATGSSGSWEQLSLAFTPTAAGIVTIRFLSSDTDGAGFMAVDDFEVAA